MARRRRGRSPTSRSGGRAPRRGPARCSAAAGQRQDARAGGALRRGGPPRTGWRPARILAITFTERAAGELRERVRARLLELGERGGSARHRGSVHGDIPRILRASAAGARSRRRARSRVHDPRRWPRGTAARARACAWRSASSWRGERPQAVDLIARLRHRPRRLDDHGRARAAAQPAAAPARGCRPCSAAARRSPSSVRGPRRHAPSSTCCCGDFGAPMSA